MRNRSRPLLRCREAEEATGTKTHTTAGSERNCSETAEKQAGVSGWRPTAGGHNPQLTAASRSSGLLVASTSAKWREGLPVR